MAESDFDKLLQEAREWDARDRARHPSSGMSDGASQDAFPARPNPPVVTVEELRKRETADLGAAREAPTIETPQKTPASIRTSFREALKQGKAQQTTVRTRRKASAWGWIVWALVIGYFVLKQYVH